MRDEWSAVKPHLVFRLSHVVFRSGSPPTWCSGREIGPSRVPVASEPRGDPAWRHKSHLVLRWRARPLGVPVPPIGHLVIRSRRMELSDDDDADPRGFGGRDESDADEVLTVDGDKRRQ